jgi:hypothetical protein
MDVPSGGEGKVVAFGGTAGAGADRSGLQVVAFPAAEVVPVVAFPAVALPVGEVVPVAVFPAVALSVVVFSADDVSVVSVVAVAV